MRIFPVGTVAASSSQGTIDSISYNMFEPNMGCRSTFVHNILVDRFEQQTLTTRKKSEPFLTLVYSYDHIFDREYRQLEHFLNDVDEALTSFYLVDFSKGQTPSNISEVSSGPLAGNWTVHIDNTRLYSTLSNYKSSKAFLWDGVNWKEGDIDSISPNVSISVDVDTNDYGNLSLANAQSSALVYPMYQVYAAAGSLTNFEEDVFVNESINTTSDGGWMRSGAITFTSKYKV
jgi:hypothetical protein